MSAARKSEALPEVLTLEEAAAFLRVPEELVRRLAAAGQLPGRKLGGQWRFLKQALRDALSPMEGFARAIPNAVDKAIKTAFGKSRRDGAASAAPASDKAELLKLAGRWKDDPTVAELLKDIYRRRGRPMVGSDE